MFFPISLALISLTKTLDLVCDGGVGHAFALALGPK
jgi:hypothetical protein